MNRKKDNIDIESRIDEEEEQDKGSSRRRLLMGLAASSAVITGQKVLPEKWTKPVVDAVILPAHAETTCEFLPDHSGNEVDSADPHFDDEGKCDEPDGGDSN
jgi:hypothetical protein